MSEERGRNRSIDDYEATVLARRPVEDEPTQLYRPGRIEAAADAETDPDAMEDPPAGWLVIVDGPGKGHVVPVGYGVNPIGRDATERVPLDYGDALISRSRHIVVTYDPRGRKFYLQHGSGSNLSYLNDQPVLAPVELEPHAQLRLGNTTLRFVPLCGPDFCWDD